MRKKFSARARHRQMIGALASRMAIEPDDGVELFEFRAAGARWRLCEDGSYRGEIKGRFRFTLSVRRFDYPSYSQDYWTLRVEGLGALAGLDETHTPEYKYFGSLATAYQMIDDYREGERAARGKPDAVERALAHIEGVFARSRAASAAIQAMSAGD